MSAAILSDFGPSGIDWKNASNNPTNFGCMKMTKEAKKEWDIFLGSYEPQESHEHYQVFYDSTTVTEVFNRGLERYGRWVENKATKSTGVGLSVIYYSPPVAPVKGPAPAPPEQVPYFRDAAVAGIVNSILNRASMIGGHYASVPAAVSEVFNAGISGDLPRAGFVAGSTAKSFLDALFGPDVPLPAPPQGDPPSAFHLIIKTGQSLSDGSAGDGLSNEIYDIGDPPTTGGGGGGGGSNDPIATPPLKFSDLSSFLDTANRLAKFFQDALNPAKTLMNRLDFISNLAGAVGSIAKTLGSAIDLAQTILDMLNDEEGDPLDDNDLLEAAIEALTPMLSEIIESIITEVFKKVRELYEKNDSSDKDTKKDKLEIDADSLRDVFNDYFLSAQDFNVADTLHAMSSMPSLGSYEIEY